MNRRNFLKGSAAAGAVALFAPDRLVAALAGERPKTLVLGGGAFALGYALAHPGETIVLERGLHLGADFSLTNEPDAVGVPATPLGRELLAALEACGIVREGHLEHPPLADFLAAFFAEHGGVSFLCAELADLKRTSHGWTAQIYGAGTSVALEFAGFLDTTDLGWRNVGVSAVSAKRFTAVTDRGVHRIDLPGTADWRTARLKLYEEIDRGAPGGAKLLAEGGALKCVYGKRAGEMLVRRGHDGRTWVPSMQFGSLTEAFEAGTTWHPSPLPGGCEEHVSEEGTQDGGTYDVVVAGLGTAGAEALRQAAASGLKALGIERTNGMGGQGTVGCVSFGGSIPMRMRDLERACVTADIAYEAVVTGARVEKNRLTGVTYLANGVARTVRTKIVIDATGNATLARLCGLPVRKGRAFDGVMAPCARAETWLLKDGGFRPIYRNYPEDLTRTAEEYSASATMLARERHRFWQVQRQKGRMLKPAMLVGAREEARVVTEEILTLDDALSERPVPNPIFHAWEPEDLPVFYGDHAFESEATQNWKVLCGLPLFGYPATLSYGTLVAKGIEGLLVPSKHFGVSHDLGGGIRMQEQMRKTGIAAALAASVALRQGCALKNVPYAALKPLLERAGLLKPPRKTFVTSCHGYAFTPFSDDEVIAALQQDVVKTTEWWYAKSVNAPSERAAYAYWTAWKRALSGAPAEKCALADRLARELAKGGRFAGNFAVALGLMKDARAVPVLRELVAHPGGTMDPVVAKAFPNRIKALLLLGRLDDATGVPLLTKVIQDEARAFTADLLKTWTFATPDLYRFQALSYALTSLKAILTRHPDAEVVRDVRAWQKKPRVLRAQDGVDLAPRLRAVRFV